MIVALEGVLESKLREGAVIRVGGISLMVLTPTTTLAQLGGEGNFVRVHTHLHVREDAMSLYGFAKADELTVFHQLITVTGVGPKLALAILSVLSPDALRRAIAEGDVETLSTIPGIGKRTASRLVVELRGKLAPVSQESGYLPGDDSSELMAALLALGYTSVEVQSAMRQLPPNSGDSLEERIVAVLQLMAQPQ